MIKLSCYLRKLWRKHSVSDASASSVTSSDVTRWPSHLGHKCSLPSFYTALKNSPCTRLVTWFQGYRRQRLSNTSTRTATRVCVSFFAFVSSSFDASTGRLAAFHATASPQPACTRFTHVSPRDLSRRTHQANFYILEECRDSVVVSAPDDSCSGYPSSNPTEALFTFFKQRRSIRYHSCSAYNDDETFGRGLNVPLVCVRRKGGCTFINVYA